MPEVGGDERRRSPRAKLDQPVRVRPADSERPVEVQRTRDVSRSGFYFVTGSGHYYIGMRACAVLGYKPEDLFLRESLGEVVRIEKLSAETRGIAVRIVMR